MDFLVRVTAQPYAVREGRLSDLSVSGGRIKTGLGPRLLSRVQIAIELPFSPKHEAPLVAGYVARQYQDGIGVEWCEFAPHPVRELLRLVVARPLAHMRRPGAPASLTISRLSAPLLKHGT